MGGPFEKWLKSVKTCRSRTECCPPAGYGNVFVRDFVTRSFTSSVINKNYMRPTGDEVSCWQAAVAKEDAEVEAGFHF